MVIIFLLYKNMYGWLILEQVSASKQKRLKMDKAECLPEERIITFKHRSTPLLKHS